MMAAAAAQFTPTSKPWMQGLSRPGVARDCRAGAVALVFAFQDLAALPVGVAQFVVNGAMFLFSFAPRATHTETHTWRVVDE